MSLTLYVVFVWQFFYEVKSCGIFKNLWLLTSYKNCGSKKLASREWVSKIINFNLVDIRFSKSDHEGGWVVKNTQHMTTWFMDDPLLKTVIFAEIFCIFFACDSQNFHKFLNKFSKSSRQKWLPHFSNSKQ